MSFHSDAMTALKAQIVTTLSLDSAAVLHGRRRQHVPRVGASVLIESLGVEFDGLGMGNQLKSHRYRVHILDRAKPEGNLTGATKLDANKAKLETLRLALDGVRRINSSDLSTNLVCVSAVEDEPDRDPEDQETLDSSLLVTLVEK